MYNILNAVLYLTHTLCSFSQFITVTYTSFTGKLYWHGSVSTTELVLYREVKCTMSLNFNDLHVPL